MFRMSVTDIAQYVGTHTGQRLQKADILSIGRSWQSVHVLRVCIAVPVCVSCFSLCQQYSHCCKATFAWCNISLLQSACACVTTFPVLCSREWITLWQICQTLFVLVFIFLTNFSQVV